MSAIIHAMHSRLAARAAHKLDVCRTGAAGRPSANTRAKFDNSNDERRPTRHQTTREEQRQQQQAQGAAAFGRCRTDRLDDRIRFAKHQQYLLRHTITTTINYRFNSLQKKQKNIEITTQSKKSSVAYKTPSRRRRGRR